MNAQVERFTAPALEPLPLIITLLVLTIIGMTGSWSWFIGATPIWMLFLALYLLF